MLRFTKIVIVLWSFCNHAEQCSSRISSETTQITAVQYPTSVSKKSVCDMGICSCSEDFKNITCVCNDSIQVFDLKICDDENCVQGQVEHLSVERCIRLRLGRHSLSYAPRLTSFKVSFIQELTILDGGLHSDAKRLTVNIQDSNIVHLRSKAFTGNFFAIVFSRCQFFLSIFEGAFYNTNTVSLTFTDSNLQILRANIFKNLTLRNFLVNACQIETIEEYALNFDVPGRFHINSSVIGTIKSNGILIRKNEISHFTNNTVRFLEANSLTFFNGRVIISDSRFLSFEGDTLNHNGRDPPLNRDTPGTHKPGPLRTNFTQLPPFKFSNVSLNKNCSCVSLASIADDLLGKRRYQSMEKFPYPKVGEMYRNLIAALLCTSEQAGLEAWNAYYKRMCRDEEEPINEYTFFQDYVQETKTTSASTAESTLFKESRSTGTRTEHKTATKTGTSSPKSETGYGEFSEEELDYFCPLFVNN